MFSHRGMRGRFRPTVVMWARRRGIFPLKLHTHSSRLVCVLLETNFIRRFVVTKSQLSLPYNDTWRIVDSLKWRRTRFHVSIIVLDRLLSSSSSSSSSSLLIYLLEVCDAPILDSTGSIITVIRHRRRRTMVFIYDTGSVSLTCENVDLYGRSAL